MLTVAFVPSGHVFVQHIDSRGGGDVLRLPDPGPPSASTEQQWWPPVMLPLTQTVHDLRNPHQHDGVLGYRLDGNEPVIEDSQNALESIGDAEAWRADKLARLEQRRSIAEARERLDVDLWRGARR